MANEKTIHALKSMLKKQHEVEHDWHLLKHQLTGIDKDSISAAFTKCRDGLQLALEIVSKSN